MKNRFSGGKEIRKIRFVCNKCFLGVWDKGGQSVYASSFFGGSRQICSGRAAVGCGAGRQGVFAAGISLWRRYFASWAGRDSLREISVGYSTTLFQCKLVQVRFVPFFCAIPHSPLRTTLCTT